MITELHTFHIPVMGLSFTIDSPVKIAKYGISSVVSLSDDILMEQMRRHYCKEYSLEYVAINPSEDDFRAKRITAYLNLLNDIVNKQFANLQKSSFEAGSEITRYFELLPPTSVLVKLYHNMLAEKDEVIRKNLEDILRNSIKPGTIDVNIMTKVDRMNHAKDGTPLPQEYSDALAGLRGYAQSNVSSLLIFSAGMNPRLFSYMENFQDFYPDAEGNLKKKVVIKVSDFRSAAIQGKFLAKKGIWVSEFRIESGLNCGGHAFATDGLLLGPILEEFKNKREELLLELHGMYNAALVSKNIEPFAEPFEQQLTVQGGIGTAEEQSFLLEHYHVDRTGWGTPFLLVPEATTVDDETIDKLVKARKEDLYLSHISPLGVPFNTIKGGSAEIQKQDRINKGKPGSPCIKKYLVSNTEFTAQPLCTASSDYQVLKIQQLDEKKLEKEAYEKEYNKITEKECLCVGLANTALINYNIAKKSKPVTICPGPNLAYFSGIFSLEEMVGHIYGKFNVLNTSHRSHMFVNELTMYIDYLEKQIDDSIADLNDKKSKYLNTFKSNLLEGIEYYKSILPAINSKTDTMKNELAALQNRLFELLQPALS